MDKACLNGGRQPKRCYATEEAARQAITESDDPPAYKPYRCKEHGWHIGGVLSRHLRRKIRAAKRAIGR